ncbi:MULTISPECIES: hypothetical protein [Agrobacterium]|uniref:hypothetical protein n=1 Tax=Agrobacterium tumefaciens complex TaxID=1183400 RepID=UPI0012E3342E|nr:MULTISPECIES: hypothetical protein [Agrobacterium tumefaciens complex]MCR6727437.1 hypothetical protein [Agrobacterium fabrum]NTA45553.1 hypothetical protein [Agrobacterium tumefaciens]NTA84432.1 hypothetical protein [Agrobacterium tumefaciens]UXT84656.1 hypothetical protein FY131_24615 [Agrobacterium tumefaciens]WIE36193.1 hypothetical protein G6L82_024210 [Agrobacterium tumefaciens]
MAIMVRDASSLIRATPSSRINGKPAAFVQGKNKLKNIVIYTALSTLIVLTGCVNNDKPWVKDESARSETDQAIAECKYQAKAATIGIGQGQQYKSFGSAIAAGIDDGIEQAVDQKELIADCMKAKGFNQ